MSIILNDVLALTPPVGEKQVSGLTCKNVESEGVVRDWTLSVEGHSDITIRDTRWKNGERDLKPRLPDPVPVDTPHPLMQLNGRRRAGIHRVPGQSDRAWMAVHVIRPGKDGWPKKTVPALEGLHMHCGRELVERVRELGITDLGPKEQLLPTNEGDRTKNHLRALFDQSEEVAPVALYATTHLVPTLRHIGWI